MEDEAHVPLTHQPMTEPTTQDEGTAAPAEPEVPIKNSGFGGRALRASPAIKEFANEVAQWGEKVKVKVLDPIPTDNTYGMGLARWRYDYTTRTHIIAMHDNVADWADEFPETDITTPDGEAFAMTHLERVLRHETWHGRITDRSPSIIQNTMDTYGVPPQLFNLFEDARIEDNARYYEGEDFGYFGEGGMYGHHMVANLTHPVLMFQYIAQCEGRNKDIAEAKKKWVGPELTEWRGEHWDTLELIEWFVQRASYASTTRHLWAPLREWLEAFGGEVPPDSAYEEVPFDAPSKRAPGMGKGTSEKAPGEGDEGDGEGDDGEPVEGAEHGTGYSDKEPPKVTERPKATTYGEKLTKGHARDKAEVIKGIEFFCHEQVDRRTGEATDNGLREGGPAPDLSATPELVQKFRRMVGFTDAMRTRTTTSGSRLHLTNVINGSSDAFRTNITRKGRRRVCVIMDMSGSMGSSFHQHGGAFLNAMLTLTRQGVWDTDIWLTGGGKSLKLPSSTTPRQVAGLTANHGSETVDATLKRALPDVLAADTVLIYTDGHLTDGDVKAGEWRGRGVDLIGVCTLGGDDEAMAKLAMAESKATTATDKANVAKERATLNNAHERVHSMMRTHFHKAIVETNAERLASRIVQYVLTRA